jgi:hypothetical protein
MLMVHIISAPEADAANVLMARHLLMNLQQRHPVVIEKVVKEVDSREDNVAQAVEELVVSLSVVSILFSYSTDLRLISFTNRPL